jgi:ubiquinone/menaquinone biosynthesis C-methylase UbiE
MAAGRGSESTLMQMTRHRMKEAAHGEFERWAQSYDRSIFQYWLFAPSYRAFLEELVAWRHDDPSPFDLLDVGCGTGTWAAMVAATALPARQIVGLDYARSMCTAARRKAREINTERVHFVNADSEHLPFADGSFDVVTCSNSFHHYPHQEAVVREFRRVLRPGGRMMIIDGFRDNLIGWIAFDVIVARMEREVHHVAWPRMRQMALDGGFAEVRQRKFGILVPLFLTVAAV